MQQHIEHKGLFKRLIREHVKPYRHWFILGVLAMLAVSASTGALALLMEPVLDDIFIGKNTSSLKWIALAIFSTFFIKGIAGYGESIVMAMIGNNIVADLQKRLFLHLLNLDMAFFHAQQTGDLMTRFTADVRVLQSVVSNTITSLGKDSMTLLVLLGVMFWQDWQLAILAFIVFPAAIYPIKRIGKRVRKISSASQQELGSFSSLLSQIFIGIRQVKAYNREIFEAQKANKFIQELCNFANKNVRARSLASPATETLAGVAIVIVIIYGGYQVIGGEKTTGSFFSFITAFLMAYEPVKKLSRVNTQIQEGVASAGRLYQVLDTQPTLVDREGVQPLKLSAGQIEFNNVSFAYKNTPVLNDISLNVSAGKRIALVGLSGGGKSTIINLIPRFYEVTSGSISIDGQSIKDVTTHSLRQQIALVSQEVFLFNDTIKNNILYGNISAKEEQIVEAAKNAAAHDFITKLPQGYDTILGEHGVNLSGGQRQRISIARAMLKDAPILLLDEATSALDTESEFMVQKALDKLMQGRTTVVVAHRLSTIQNADCIYVMEQGRIVEYGTHQQLLEKGGTYQNLLKVKH